MLGQQQQNPSGGGTGTEAGTDVLGATEEQGVTANIPNTGADVGGYLVLAGIAILLGGLAVRFGQAEEPAQA